MKLTIDTSAFPEVCSIEKTRILKSASEYVRMQPVHITDERASGSQGGPNDYYSEAIYWWPDPKKPKGLPYIRKDGQSNPNAFSKHLDIMRALRTRVATLAAAYCVTKTEMYAKRAILSLKEFFLDPGTRMNPHLNFSQATPGVCAGRSYGVIDTVHLLEIPLAVEALRESPNMDGRIYAALQGWFREYLRWLVASPNGQKELGAVNNHGVCWALQATMFGLFTENPKVVNFCRSHFKSVLLPKQMGPDGGFPRELARTKPYSYSIFTLDCMSALCHLLCTESENLWEFQLADGRGMRQGLHFLYPYLVDKTRWPCKPDIEFYDSWPVKQACLLLGGYAFGENAYLELWERLDPDPSDYVARCSLLMRQPLLWVRSSG